MRTTRSTADLLKALILASAVSAAVAVLAACGHSASGPAAGQGGGVPGQSGGAPGQNAGARPGQQSGGGPGGRRAMAVPVQTVTANVGILNADRDAAGVVTPVTQSQVAAQVAGVVQKVLRAAGDWVQAGDVVIQLDDSQLRLAAENARLNLSIGQDNVSQANPKLVLQLQSAQAALSSAQKNYDSQKALYNLGGISSSQLDNYASQLAAAQANVEGAKTALDQNQRSGEQVIAQLKVALSQAQLNLQYSSIKAPFSGQIAAINVQPGMYVGLNTQAFVLVSAERQINFSVSPGDAPALPAGTDLTFEQGGKSHAIRVSQAPSAPINGVIPMVALPKGRFDLPYGAVGNVSFLVSLARGALVPLAALGTLENQNFVFVVDGGKVVQKPVAVLAEAGITAAVSGIDSGTVVVVSPPPGLLNGSSVQVVGQAAVPGNGVKDAAAPGPAPLAGPAAQGPAARGAAAEGAPAAGRGSGRDPAADGGGQGSAPAQGAWQGQGGAPQGTRQGQGGNRGGGRPGGPGAAPEGQAPGGTGAPPRMMSPNASAGGGSAPAGQP